MGVPWLDEPAPAIPLRKLEGTVDVAIVGGGIAGCTCALALAQAGKRVRVYDARAVGGGARQ